MLLVQNLFDPEKATKVKVLSNAFFLWTIPLAVYPFRILLMIHNYVHGSSLPKYNHTLHIIVQFCFFIFT